MNTHKLQDMTTNELSSSSLSHSARRIVAIVAVLNLLGCLVEAFIAARIGSAALLADAADFLEDFLINALVLTALGWSAAGRRKASYGLAGLILIPAGAALGMAIYKIVSGEPPEAFTLSATAIGAGLLNLLCAILLVQLRSGNALTRGAWLAARNDVAANILILGAGVLTIFWFSIWPDVLVGVVIAIINLSAAKEVFEQARAEDPEIE